MSLRTEAVALRLPNAPVRVSLLNGFQLAANGEIVPLPMALQRVVAFLALHNRPIRRLYLAAVLWSETSETKASARLRSALWRLRQSRLPLVETPTGHVRLGPDIDVDVREAEALARRLVDPIASCDDLIVDLAWLSADLLPDWYEDWVLIERERFRQLRLHGLESLCERLAVAGRVAQAVEAGLTAVAAEPLRESARRALVSLYLAEGNQAEAVREVDRFRSLLRSELGVEPSAELVGMVSGPSVRSQDR